ncbi:1-(5-phosphoribosyl)-5-[(5-phosphoribosylamino)methylideneamino] imidazole-4-carboxamide isomerase, chloroplastic isoform X2 [Capsicum annuum]|uniref:1-(5-phosphoribosyl)-5-[(5- phosphoribosylamino)methylideneamino] imidazole-4-carboxamide isomerase, chloroplastic isoform X2 n=1 Tax=Capsicum annuum TaxID=4072 RepID=UPI001FB19FFE|nr:1-(5-phosphoribosyl)-5-[(5-phosphoribosylamino)methylideneamino] imidazole-4-carboxamide isomerase, chloroplastic isoform X2 [Capsicum annuum]
MQSLQATSASSLQNLFWGKNLSYESCTLSRTQEFIPNLKLPPLGPQRLSVQCGVGFRPCIDIHKGKVKQIVGSTLQDSKEADASLVTNFESDKSAAEYAKLYRDDGLVGGHVIMLGADPLSIAAATEALHAYPGGLQVGGGIKTENALSYIEEGASHVIVTSYVFNNGQMDLERLKALSSLVGRKRLVLDLSCRKKEGEYVIVTDRWQKFSDVHLNEKVLNFLAEYADEFLVHGVDVEGKKLGIDEELVALLGKYSPVPKCTIRLIQDKWWPKFYLHVVLRFL